MCERKGERNSEQCLVFFPAYCLLMPPGTSALFVLVDSDLTDKVLDALRGTGGTVLQSSLSHEDEAKLQAALNSARAAQKDAE